MESRSGNTLGRRGSRGGRGFPPSAGLRSRQFLARMDARPLAARAAADVSALVRRAGTTLRLRPKEAVNFLDSADIEVTDSRLPHTTLVEHQCQPRRSDTLGKCTAPLPVTQDKANSASKPPQTSGRFSVELVRGPAGFGLTLSGGKGVPEDAPLAVRGLLKDGPAQRFGLQAGDLVLRINGESTEGLTHAQVLEQIRAGGPRLHLLLHRPQETQCPPKLEGIRRSQKGDRSPDPRSPGTRRSRSASISPVHHSRSSTTPKIRGSPEPRPEVVADSPEIPTLESRIEDLDGRIPSSPGPWLVPSEERLFRALGIPRTAQLDQEMAAGRRRH
ncbi:PDZ domain-containing protein MAGIX isoform X2 [Perognathus longimembris pacificus]|uniref:PDZ domain-containing protein MAGIX isoform X2 n=1 Tax=Perognathus longimembris pacificus TaxID=214514 RepID=UPI0020196675|nr:PDZ domain-containing protein MAGIX isoform X2 [Perognathus longimembris pacificus]